MVRKFLLCTVYSWRAGSCPSRPEGGLSVSSVLIMSLFVCVFVFILTCLHCCSPGVWFSDDIPGMCAHACMLRISFLAQDVLAHNHRASLITSLELWCSQLPVEGVYGVSPSRVSECLPHTASDCWIATTRERSRLWPLLKT